MSVYKEQQIESKDLAKPIELCFYRGRIFNATHLNNWADQAHAAMESDRLFQTVKTAWPYVGLLSLVGGLLIPASMDNGNSAFAEGECSWDRAWLWSKDGSSLSVYSQCEGPVYPLFPYTENQELAMVRANILTTNLGETTDRTRYEYLNVPYQELPLDRVSGNQRLMADAELLEIMKGNTITPEGSERVEALQLALNKDASDQFGSPKTLDFNNLMLLYTNDSSQPNDISQVTVDTLRYLGVKDEDIFKADARIHFRNGVPYEVKEWQTALRPSEASPNQVIYPMKSRIGDHFVVIEESGLEGWIQLIPDADTRRGIRSANVQVSMMFAPINEDPDYVMMIIVDRSCGNFIAQFPVPLASIEEIEELVEATPTPTSSPAPTSPATPPPPGGGGPGPQQQPTSQPEQPTPIGPGPTQIVVPTAPAPTSVPPTPIGPGPTQIVVPTAPPPTSVPPTSAPTSAPANTPVGFGATQAPVATRT